MLPAAGAVAQCGRGRAHFRAGRCMEGLLKAMEAIVSLSIIQKSGISLLARCGHQRDDNTLQLAPRPHF